MFKKILLPISIALSLPACGGGSSNDAGSNMSNNGGGNNNGSNPTTPASCNKGIPTGLAKLGSGMLDEAVYSLDVNYEDQNQSSPFNQLLFSYEYTLLNNIYYEKISAVNKPNFNTDFFNSMRPSYILTSTATYTTNTQAKSVSGWPIAYITEMNASQFSSVGFNDQCNLKVDNINHEYEKVDVSGQPISIFLERDPSTTFIGYKYLENAVGYFLNPSSLRNDQEKARDQSYKDMLKSTDVFPNGSYIYIAKKINHLENIMFFYEDSISEQLTLADWAKDSYPKVLTWKEDSFGGQKVIYALNEDQSIKMNIDPAMEKNGKIYDGEWTQKGNYLEQRDKSAQGENILFNKAAHDTFINQVNKFYQL